MAKIVNKRIGFAPSPSLDTAGYFCYYAETPVDYSSPQVDLGLPNTVTHNTHGEIIVVDLALLELAAGTWHIGIAPYDATGNIGDIKQISVVVDLEAPQPVPFIVEL